MEGLHTIHKGRLYRSLYRSHEIRAGEVRLYYEWGGGQRWRRETGGLHTCAQGLVEQAHVPKP